jgi:hypothetical protein
MLYTNVVLLLLLYTVPNRAFYCCAGSLLGPDDERDSEHVALVYIAQLLGFTPKNDIFSWSVHPTITGTKQTSIRSYIQHI